MFGKDWNAYFKETYGAENIIWKPNSFDDIIQNPEMLIGIPKDDVGRALGSEFVEGKYASSKTGWKFTSSTGSVFYHPGGGKHTGSYHGYSTGPTRKVKIVDKNYINLPGDNARIIKQ